MKRALAWVDGFGLTLRAATIYWPLALPAIVWPYLAAVGQYADALGDLRGGSFSQVLLRFWIPAVVAGALLWLTSMVLAASRARRQRLVLSSWAQLAIPILTLLVSAATLWWDGGFGLAALSFSTVIIWMTKTTGVTAPGQLRLRFLLFAAALTIAWIALAGLAFSAGMARAVGPFGVTFIGLGLMASVTTVLLVVLPTLLGPTRAWTLYAIVIGCALLIRAIPTPTRQLTLLPGTQAYPDESEAFRRWLTQRVPEDSTGPIPVVLVAADGGGIRAAYWTARTLTVLDERTGGLSSQFTFAYSGVSGGSLGIATFLAAQQAADGDSAAALRMIDAFFRVDLFSPTIARFFTTEPLHRLLGGRFIRGRGTIFEDNIAQSWRAVSGAGLFSEPVLTALGPSLDMATPIVMFNASSADTGRRVRISNSATSGGTRAIEPVALARNYRIADMSLVHAVHHSARFPLMSPPGSLARVVCKVEPESTADRCEGRAVHWLSLVDGGYVDNSGVDSLMELVGNLSSQRRLGTEQRAGAMEEVSAYLQLLDRVSFHVLLITNNPSLNGAPDPEKDTDFLPLGEIEAIVSAFEGARHGRAFESGLALDRWVRNTRRFEWLQESICGSHEVRTHVVPEVYRFRERCIAIPDSALLLRLTQELQLSGSAAKVSEYGDRIDFLPLGWSLSERAALAIERSSTEQPKAFVIFNRLTDWWRGLLSSTGMSGATGSTDDPVLEMP